MVPAPPREQQAMPSEPQWGTPASPPQTWGPPPPPGQVPSPYASVPPVTNGLAIASFVCSLTGALACFAIPFVNLLLAIPGIAMGHVARTQIRNARGAQAGDGLAIAGLVIGYLQLVLMCLGGALILALGLAFSFSLADLFKQVP